MPRKQLYTVTSTHTGEQRQQWATSRKAAQWFVDMNTTPAPAPHPRQLVQHLANYQPVYYPAPAVPLQPLATAAD